MVASAWLPVSSFPASVFLCWWWFVSVESCVDGAVGIYSFVCFPFWCDLALLLEKVYFSTFCWCSYLSIDGSDWWSDGGSDRSDASTGPCWWRNLHCALWSQVPFYVVPAHGWDFLVPRDKGICVRLTLLSFFGLLLNVPRHVLQQLGVLGDFFPPMMMKVRSLGAIASVIISTLYSALIFRILSSPLPMFLQLLHGMCWTLQSWGSYSWPIAPIVLLRLCFVVVPDSAVSIASKIFSGIFGGGSWSC